MLKRILFQSALFLIAALSIVGCQNSVGTQSQTSSQARTLTISWNQSSPKSKTILPSTYPTPSSYTVTLQPSGGGTPITQSGITSTSWTSTTLTSAVYSVSVIGSDSSGNVLATGTASVDTTSNASSTVSVTMSYITAGTGTGGISLTLDLSSASGVGTITSATMKLIDPSGNITTPTLSASGSNYIYANNSAVVGSYQAVFTLKTTTKTAMKFDEVVVAQGITTMGTESFATSDFGNTYVAVSSLTLNKSTSSAVNGGSDILTPTFNSGASNTLVTWKSSNSSYATVDQIGEVSILVSGPQTVTITATSVDNPLVSASCVYTILSTAKAMSSFAFLSPAATGTISGTAIAVTVPYGTDVTKLVATFTTTGASVAVGTTAQVSGTTPNDFTNPVTYTVTAEDGSTQSYTVTVTVTSSISITFTTSSYQTLSFSSTALTTAVGTAIEIAPTGSVTSGGTSWQWYVNGTLSSSSSSFSFTPTTPGFYTVSVTVVFGGTSYSGSLNITASR